MSISEPTSLSAQPPVVRVGESAVTPRSGRPIHRVLMHWVRRTHLYLGLFLFPWAVLYGVTGFLFNHPMAFSDQPSKGFGRPELRGTPMETPTPPAEVAAQVVAALNQRAKSTSRYHLVEPSEARYTREFAFATVKSDDGGQVSLLFDVSGKGGTVRTQPPAVSPAVDPAPFAVGRLIPSTGRAGRGTRPQASRDGIRLTEPLQDRVLATVPVVLERTGFGPGKATVTSVPDLSFQMQTDEVVWTVTYNSLSGAVAGTKSDTAKRPTLSVRRFLTRLHLAHGYPPSGGVRWYWAVIVDLMAFVMVFWGVSGLLMWWQIKATRWFGFLTLIVSAVLAAGLTIGMHRLLTS